MEAKLFKWMAHHKLSYFLTYKILQYYLFFHVSLLQSSLIRKSKKLSFIDHCVLQVKNGSTDGIMTQTLLSYNDYKVTIE